MISSTHVRGLAKDAEQTVMMEIDQVLLTFDKLPLAYGV